MNEQDLLFRCHFLSDFASTSAEENKNPYFATLKAIEKTQGELETLKQAKAIEARNELLVELKSEYDENSNVVSEFGDFVNELKSKLTPDDAKKLLEFSTKLTKVKRCAKKGVEAVREIARDQRKATRETIREYQEYLYV